MRPPLFILLSLVFLCGCRDHRKAEVVTIAKEEPPEIVPVSLPSESMARQRLPEEVVNTSGPDPVWSVPEGWSEAGDSPMRRGSFSATGSAGSVDIAVTSFPGDVGGLLANVNRWRRQIGVAPIGATELEHSVERLQIHGKEAVVTEITGSIEATLAAVFEHEGQSWFFKATGPKVSVAEQKEAFLGFLQTIRFSDGEEN